MSQRVTTDNITTATICQTYIRWLGYFTRMSDERNAKNLLKPLEPPGREVDSEKMASVAENKVILQTLG